MSLVLQSSGGGSVTIAEPTTASNFTQTLPASDGTIVTTGSPQSGGVIQVVSEIIVSTTTTTSTTPVSTGLSVSITPKFSTSKIFIFASYNLDNDTSGNNAFSTIYRNSTNLGVNGYFGQVFCNPARSIVSICSSFLDSPATVSSTTYAIYFAIPAGGTIGFNTNSQSCTITAMEIAA